MNYINQTPNPSGAYPSPQSTPAPGLLPLTDEQAAMIQYNGFVILTIEDVAEQVGGNPTDLVVVKKVTAVEPNTDAWEAWKEAEAAKPKPEPVPTPEERIAVLETDKADHAEVQAIWDKMDAAYTEGVNAAYD